LAYLVDTHALELIAGARNQREVADLDVLISAYEQIPPNEEIAPRAYALMKTFARSHGLHPKALSDDRRLET